METRKLKIEDVNNKLQCMAFLVIQFAPPEGVVRSEDFQRLYAVEHEGKTLLVKLVDFARVPFNKIPTIVTLPATGFESKAWRELWRQRHPQTKDDTEMAVYCYVRAEGYRVS